MERNQASRSLRSFLAAESDRSQRGSQLESELLTWMLQWVGGTDFDTGEAHPSRAPSQATGATGSEGDVDGPVEIELERNQRTTTWKVRLNADGTPLLQHWLPQESWPSGLVSVAEQLVEEERPAPREVEESSTPERSLLRESASGAQREMWSDPEGQDLASGSSEKVPSTRTASAGGYSKEEA